jgi:hypothetical protein
MRPGLRRPTLDGFQDAMLGRVRQDNSAQRPQPQPRIASHKSHVGAAMAGSAARRDPAAPARFMPSGIGALTKHFYDKTTEGPVPRVTESYLNIETYH